VGIETKIIGVYFTSSFLHAFS